MAEPLTSIPARRWLGPVALLALTALALCLHFLLHIALRRTAVVSGVALLALVLALTAFNARKKLPFLPLLRASTWMQFHVYAGWFSVVLFLLHIRFRVPQGALEIWLTLLFLAVAGSGVVGLVLSRSLPPRLSRHGEELIFERIPSMRRQLQQEVEQLVLQSVTETGSSTIADFYAHRLKFVFERPRNLWLHCWGSDKPLHELLNQIAARDRFLNARERELMVGITERLRAKDNLDFHLACQGLLKLWLFMHVPLSYALILVALAHGALAWSFTKGGG